MKQPPPSQNNDLKSIRYSIKWLLLIFLFIAVAHLPSLLFNDFRPSYLQPLVSLVDDELKQKIKSLLGVQSSYQKSVSVQIDGHPLNLTSDNKIYISHKEQTGLTIKVYNFDNEVVCFDRHYSQNNIVIDLENFDDCNLSLVPARVTLSGVFSGRTTFLVASQAPFLSNSVRLNYVMNTVKNNSAVLFVLPVTNWFFYADFPNRYWDSEGLVYLRTDLVKPKLEDFWVERSINSMFATITALGIDKANVVYDYHLSGVNLTNFETVVLALHNEYATADTVARLRSFVDEGGNVILLGGAPLNRQVDSFNENSVILSPNQLNFSDYDFPSFDRDLFARTGGGQSGCVYSSDTFSNNFEHPAVGEMVRLIEDNDGTRTDSISFSDCLSEVVPNISSTCFDDGGCIISITSDGVAERLNELNRSDIRLLNRLLE